MPNGLSRAGAFAYPANMDIEVRRHTRLRRWVAPVALLALLVPATAQAQSSPVKLGNAAPKLANLDFEDGAPGLTPPGWTATTAAQGFIAETSVDTPRSGKQCALLRAENPTGGFGILMQSIDATPYRGHRIRLRGALRVDPSSSATRAHLWLRVDRSANRTGFFDNMMNRSVTAATWTGAEIVGDVDDDAETINLGLLMLGSGRCFVDAVTLEDLGKVTVVTEPARPITDRGLANLEAFTRLLGYVRHFHPSDQAAAADWDAFAVNGIRKIESAASPAELATGLNALFAPVAPSVRVFVTGQAITPVPDGNPNLDGAGVSVVQWRHEGVGLQGDAENVYSSTRETKPVIGGRIPEGFRDPRMPFVRNLAGGVTCSVPLSLFTDANGSLPRPAASASRPPELVRYTGNDRATRLAAVALAWNVFQHFYPYFDVVKTDWPSLLGPTLRAAAECPDDVAFTFVLRRLVWALHDGHGSVTGPAPNWFAAVPVSWTLIDDQLVVTAVDPSAAGGIVAGDVVESIDGQPVRAAIDDAQSHISSATAQWSRHRALTEIRLGPPDSQASLVVRSADGSRRTVVVKRSATEFALDSPRPAKIAEVKPGVYYIDVGRITDDDFTQALPALEKARGIVFDMRGYPSRLSPMPLQHLTGSAIESARWQIPTITVPDGESDASRFTGERWNLPPLAPRLTAKLAFLTDGRAISYAESWMGIVEAYRLGAIVGEATAGTNGNVNPFVLPGGYRVTWTGMRVLKHDGSRHHGVGILPTIPVTRTIKGVAAGRDESLERAIVFVESP